MTFKMDINAKYFHLFLIFQYKRIYKVQNPQIDDKTCFPCSRPFLDPGIWKPFRFYARKMHQNWFIIEIGEVMTPLRNNNISHFDELWMYQTDLLHFNTIKNTKYVNMWCIKEAERCTNIYNSLISSIKNV